MSKHRHQWVISQEVFGSALGGEYRLIWCVVCRKPPAKGQFPLELAEAVGAVTPAGARPWESQFWASGTSR